MVRELVSRSTVPRKYCPCLTTKGFSTISLIRITGMALLCDRVGDTLHTNREKIEISRVFMELLGFKVVVRAGECLGYLNCC